MFLRLAPRARWAFPRRKGEPAGTFSIEEEIQGTSSCGGHPVIPFGVDEWVGDGGLALDCAGGWLGRSIAWMVWQFSGRFGSGMGCGGLRCAGFDLGCGRGIDWRWIDWRGFFGGLPLSLAEPLRGIDVCPWDGGGDGCGWGWGEAAVGDESFDGYDHGKRLDLAGHAAAGGFGIESCQLPEAGEDLVAADIQGVQLFGLLLRQLFLDSGAVLAHIRADAGLALGVGGGAGIEPDGFGGAAIIHGSGKNQVSKGHFLIGDGIGDVVFGHGCLFLRWLKVGLVGVGVSLERGSGAAAAGGGSIQLMRERGARGRSAVRVFLYAFVTVLEVANFGQGSGVTPDSGKAILCSRGRPVLRQEPDRLRQRELPPPADIVCSQR